MRRTTQFRRLMEAPEILLLPGVHDALSLRIAEQAGFQAVAAGGYSATASLLGAPDVGQLTMTEMAEMYARLAERTSLPIFADADTGHGNTSNVARTVRAFERAGVAALFIEDQLAPKRCGHMEGKRVVPPVEMVAKLKAALDARVDGDMVICARTDARAVEGLDAAIERAELYREAATDNSMTQELLADCAPPAVPALPDASTVSMEEMVASQRQVREFVSAGEADLACLSEIIDDEDKPWR